MRTFRKNAVVIHEGETGDSLYVILSGRMKIFVADGRRPGNDSGHPGPR
ncbi:MAG: cyclic nucleotide-binding domain-containing protein [Comamonadaceae bacterium]|nr:cyclic nucleotide-binding domain-containing protein [Comamonadaceae bacterium]